MEKRKKRKLILIQAAPLIYSPPTRPTFFSYWATNQTRIGDLIKIPFGQRKILGVVWRKNIPQTKTAFFIKKIEKIIQPKIFYSNQKKLASFLADNYFFPLGLILKNFLPDFNLKKNKNSKKKLSAKNHSLFSKTKNQLLRQSPDLKQQQILKKLNLSQDLKNISLSSKKNSFYLIEQSFLQKIQLIQKLKKELKSNEQILIFFPDNQALYQWQKKIQNYLSIKELNSWLFLNKKSKLKFLIDWQKIASSQIKIILTVRAGLLAPFLKLKFIFLENFNSDTYYQNSKRPFFDLRIFSQKMAYWHQAKLIFLSDYLNLKSYWQIKQKKFILLNSSLKNLLNSKNKISIQISDLSQKKSFRQNLILDKFLKEKIEIILKKKKQIIFLTKQSGASAFSLCQKCKKILRCPQCQKILIYNLKLGCYFCYQCSYQTDILFHCPRCNHTRFSNFGFGAQSIQREIKKYFPQIKSLIVKNNPRSNQLFEKKFKLNRINFKNQKINILIGSLKNIFDFSWKKVALIIYLDFDRVFFRSNFDAFEKKFLEIKKIQKKATFDFKSFLNSRENIQPQIIIPTERPQNDFLKNLVNSDSMIFFQEELKQRKTLGFPPFIRFIKIDFYFKNQLELEVNQTKILEELKKIQKKFPQKILKIIKMPTNSFSSKSIILKVSLTTPPLNLKIFLKNLPIIWKIKVDAPNIF